MLSMVFADISKKIRRTIGFISHTAFVNKKLSHLANKKVSQL